MKYQTRNGWTKEKMIKQIQTKMLDHQSMNDLKHCVYLSPDGNRCAVGVFIPSDEYKESFEYRGLDHITETTLIKFPLDNEGMQALQDVHDTKKGDRDPRPGDRDPRPRLIAWIKENVVDEEKKDE